MNLNLFLLSGGDDAVSPPSGKAKADALRSNATSNGRKGQF